MPWRKEAATHRHIFVRLANSRSSDTGVSVLFLATDSVSRQWHTIHQRYFKTVTNQSPAVKLSPESRKAAYLYPFTVKLLCYFKLYGNSLITLPPDGRTFGHHSRGCAPDGRFSKLSSPDEIGKMELIIKERRLRWLGHVLRMEYDRIPKQAVYWQLDQQAKRKPGRPRKNWIDVIRHDLKTIGMAWEDAEQSATNRDDWRRSVAQCVYDTGWHKSKSSPASNDTILRQQSPLASQHPRHDHLKKIIQAGSKLRSITNCTRLYCQVAKCHSFIHSYSCETSWQPQLYNDKIYKT